MTGLSTPLPGFAGAMAARTPEGYYFDDFVLGARIVHPTPRTLTAGDVALYQALTGSRFAPQSAVTVANAMGYAAQPVDDWLVFHIAFGKTVPDISLNAVANLGYADARFLAPVFVGDTLAAESEVIGLKLNSNGKTGVVYVRSTATVVRAGCTDGQSELALTWVRWVMINRRAGADAGAVHQASVPNLVARVDVDRLAHAHICTPQALHSAQSGGARFFADYSVGEVIDHPGGMTIDSSDHTLATKLYQNTARVHFDGFAMQGSRFGQRLMYGGHVISVCRALSFDGLENAFAIAAMNGGSHTNPTFAGDTLYCRSVVLEKLAVRSDLGALRLRMLGLKNAPLSTLNHEASEPNAQLVLDLDYTVWIPIK